MRHVEWSRTGGGNKVGSQVEVMKRRLSNKQKGSIRLSMSSGITLLRNCSKKYEPSSMKDEEMAYADK